MSSYISEETRLYRWLLEQRLLADVDMLEAWKVRELNKMARGWNTELTNADLGHALAVDDGALNAALEMWWNLNGMSSTPLTFAEIRAKAAFES